MTRRFLLPLLLLGLLAATACSSTKPAAPAASTSAPAAASTYRRDADRVLEALATNSNAVADVMAKSDPANAQWRSTLGTKLDALAQVDTQARGLKPEAADAALQTKLLEITGDFARAAQLIRGAVDPINVDALDQAAQILGTGVTKVAALRAELPPQG